MLFHEHARGVHGNHGIHAQGTPPQTRLHDFVLHRAKAEHHAPLLLIEGIEARNGIKGEQHAGHQGHGPSPKAPGTATTTGATAATKEAAELALQLAECFV